MAANANERMLVTFRVNREQLAATMLRLHEDWLMKQQLDLVSIRPESEDDRYRRDDAVLAMDAELVASSVVRQIDEYMAAPPDTNYLCGWLDALVNLYREGGGLNDRRKGDARIWVSEWLTSNAYVSDEPQSAESGRPADDAQ